MTYPILASNVDTHDLPTGPAQLTPDRPPLFYPMSVETALACLGAGRLLSTRDMLGRPELRALGVQVHVRSRLDARLTHPFHGTVGDAVPLSFTPHTRAVLASCGTTPQVGAEPIPREQIVIAIVSLDDLRAAGVPLVFSDRAPTRPDAEMIEDVRLDSLPWNRFRTRNFAARDADREELARYGAEVLVWMGVPLGLVRECAVVSQNIAAELNERASASGLPALFKSRPGWFFG